MPDEILLLSSTTSESANLIQLMDRSGEDRFIDREIQHGKICGASVSAVVTGIGAVNTARVLTCALERSRPRMVLQIGVGGAYLSSELEVGDVAVADREIYGDLGVIAPDGWHSTEFIGIPILTTLDSSGKVDNHYNEYPIDQGLAESSIDAISAADWGQNPPAIASGTFVTVNQCSGVAEVGNEIASRFGGICENMEGAAAAHLCLLYKVPFVEVRSISNRVEDRNFEAWDIPMAISHLHVAVSAILQDMGTR